MMNRCIGRIIGWQIKKGILPEAQRATYEYAYEVMISKVINILIAVLIAFLFRAPVTVAVLLVVYIPMRTYAGGYHAETNLWCTFVSAVMIVGVCLMVKYYPIDSILPFNIAASLSSICIIWMMAPVEAAHKPLDELEFKRYRLRTRILLMLGMIVSVILYCFGFWQISFVMNLAYIILAAMLIVGKVKTDVPMSEDSEDEDFVEDIERKPEQN